MARSILAAVRRIKADVARVLQPQLIRSACAAAGHSWRDRLLDPVVTVHLFVLQVLNGNTACAHVPRLGAVRRVPDRPGRLEPRAVKRRPKEYDRLNQPRDVLRKRLLRKKHAA